MAESCPGGSSGQLSGPGSAKAGRVCTCQSSKPGPLASAIPNQALQDDVPRTPIAQASQGPERQIRKQPRRFEPGRPKSAHMKIRSVDMRLLAKLPKSGQRPESRRLGVFNGPMNTKAGAESNNLHGESGATETKLESGRAAVTPCHRKASAGSAEVNIPHSALPQPSKDDLPGVVLENIVLLAPLDVDRGGRRAGRTLHRQLTGDSTHRRSPGQTVGDHGRRASAKPAWEAEP